MASPHQPSVCSWPCGRGRGGYIAVYTLVIRPSSFAANMDRVFSGWSTTLSNSVQTALMIVSHFILGSHFCSGNGHNYVAKLKGAKIKHQASPAGSDLLRASPLLACGKSKYYQESDGKKQTNKGGEISDRLDMQRQQVGVSAIAAAVVTVLQCVGS